MEWRVVGAVYPFGDWRADYRTAAQSALMANLWGRKKGNAPFRPDQFMPRFGETRSDASKPAPSPKTKTPDELFAIIVGINADLGGDFVDNRPPEMRGAV